MEAENEEVVPVEAAPEAMPADEVMVVVTAPGSFGPEGLAAVGEKRLIPVAVFSPTWMRPADAASAKRVKRYMDANPKRF
jgi:hypothetical protein